jgi:DNA-binding beta-propeller fold protein YncE
MRIAQGLMIGAVAGAIGVACLWQFGCEDKPTEPKPPDEPKDYVVYCWDGSSALEYFGYHPQTGKLDSFSAPTYAWNGFTVSSDGKRLFSAERTRTLVIDLATLEPIAELPYTAGRGICCSPDGRYVALKGGTNLHVLSCQDYSLVYFDSAVMLRGGWFSPDGDRFYAATGDSLAIVYQLDLANGFTVSCDTLSDRVYLCHMLPSPDETKWFLYRQFNAYQHSFEAYDVQLDSVIFRDYLLPGDGEMVVTPDVHYVFYTQPGPPQMDFTGPPHFTVFDAWRNRIDRLVSVTGMVDGINPEYLPLNELAITPDGRWLIVGGFYPADQFVVFDIATLNLVRLVTIPDNGIRSYTCQAGL